MAKVALLTSGGDSPGMNAVLHSFAKVAAKHSVECIFVEDGYQGLIDGRFQNLSIAALKSSIFSPGTLIGSSRCLEFKNVESSRKKAIGNLIDNKVDCLVVVGGNGSYKGAELIQKLNFPVIAIPGTIDNDVASSDYTVGFFSAMEEIVLAIRKVKATSNSHSQITFLEVMGRHCCDLALFAGIASSADYLITNQNPKNVDELTEIVLKMKKEGNKGIVIVVSEKVYGESFGFDLPALSLVASEMEKKVNCQVRVSVLGNLQRGAFPTSWELFAANGFGKYAFELFSKKVFNVAIGFNGKDYYYTPLEKANKINSLSRFEDIVFHNSLSI